MWVKLVNVLWVYKEAVPHRLGMSGSWFLRASLVGQMIMNLPAIQELLLLLSHFSHVQLCVIPQTAATRLPHPWDSPGKNTGVGCHFLLQCMKVKSESEVAQSCPTLSDPMDCSLPGSSIHGIFQAKYWSGVPLPSPQRPQGQC